MYLKKLNIKGFKSFADNTEISLQPGINLIVGPNGCGKSNIVDAIRWCLGENNVRNLRGSKGEDIIFNGTDDKRAQSMAFVEMVVDNQEQILPVEYGEVNLARKLFRSGESEFYINKTKMRMKDVNRLFTGTGLGKKGYSIVSQGELEQVLNGQPLDRRLILEEASGIIKYRQQREEVNRRIANTANDLIRLQDILGELKQRKEELQLKAEKANKYKRLNEEKQKTLENILRYELWKMKQDLEKKAMALQQKKSNISQVAGALEMQEAQIAEKELLASELREKVNKKKEEKYRLDSNVSALKNEIRLAEERIANFSERLTGARENEIKYREMLGKLQNDLSAHNKDYEQQKSSLNTIEINYKSLHEQISAAESAMAAALLSYEKKKASILELELQKNTIKNKILEIEKEIKELSAKREKATILSADFNKKISRKEELADSFKQEISEYELKINRLKENLNKMQQEKLEKEKAVKRQLDRNFELSQAEMRMDKKILLLKEMDKNMEGYSRAAKAVMEYSRQGRLHGIKGVVGEVIDVPEGLETAIEIILGKKAENVIVIDSNKAREAIEFLKSRQLGRLTFLPLDVLKNTPLPKGIIDSFSQYNGVLGIASDLINYQPEYKKTVDYLLGRALVVNNIETGIKVFKDIRYPLQIVTLEGELISFSGAMTGGSLPNRRETPFKRKKEMKELLAAQAELKLQMEKIQQETEKRQQELDEQKKNVDSNKNSLIEMEFRLQVLLKQKGDNIIELQKDREDWELLSEQMGKIELDYNQFQQALNTWQQKKGSIRGNSEKETAELEQVKEKIAIEEREYEVHKERLNAYKERINSKAQEIAKTEQNIRQFNQVRDSYLQSGTEAGELKEKLLKMIKVEQEKKDENQIVALKNEQDLRVLKEMVIDLQSKEKGVGQEIERIRRQISPARQTLIQIENSARGLEISWARLEAEYKALCNQAQCEYKLDAEHILQPNFTATEIKEYKQKVESLATELNGIGNVDLDAIQEFEAINDRFIFLQHQNEDLIAGKEALSILLKDTERIMSRDFADFVSLAQESFARTFQEIFGGGEANLRLGSGQDKLEAGIEIEVKLPGKKSQALNLLSGGERALTCIAFIFALLRLNPAPFSILDEIDASLDETNLHRFASFLKKMGKEMQYIVITHRQATIQAGDNIYGVTMPEKGVSRVFTLNVNEAESRAG